MLYLHVYKERSHEDGQHELTFSWNVRLCLNFHFMIIIIFFLERGAIAIDILICFKLKIHLDSIGLINYYILSDWFCNFFYKFDEWSTWNQGSFIFYLLLDLLWPDTNIFWYDWSSFFFIHFKFLVSLCLLHVFLYFFMMVHTNWKIRITCSCIYMHLKLI